MLALKPQRLLAGVAFCHPKLERTEIVAFAWFRKTEGFVPAEGLFQPGRFPAPGWFQPRAFSSLGLLPARGIVQQRVCSRQKLVKNILGMFRAWVFSSSSLVPAPGCFQRGVVSTSGLITPICWCFVEGGFSQLSSQACN